MNPGSTDHRDRAAPRALGRRVHPLDRGSRLGRRVVIVILTAMTVGGCASADSATPAPGDTTRAGSTPGAPSDTAPPGSVPADASPATPPNSDVPADASPATPPNSDAPGLDHDFAPLNPATGFGLLRAIGLDERPGPRDVVIYAAIPNELPRVAGVITTVAQTPLSHVNLRAVQDNVPNAFIAGALDNPEIAALLGKYVRYTVTSDGFSVEAASQAEVEAHHDATRPKVAQTPERDLSVTAITPLAEIGFDDWRAFGVKAANLATLATFELPDATIPDGYAVPFAFYDEFMTVNGFYDRVREMLDDPEFRADPDEQDRQLARLREAIRDADLPDEMVAELTDLQQSFPANTPIRCRSSTNNEDLPGFSGAGLYDSKTQRPDEGHISKCIKQVYASVWNLRAFLERDFHRIDHLATAMGVLAHPNSDDETVNGVAVSIDPVYDTPDAYYVNSQLGEDLVTNPEALSIPEAILIGTDGAVAVINRSNLATPGTLLMTEAQTEALRASLATIHTRFAELYDTAPGDRFAMEIEFKIKPDGSLQIKQARNWVFH